MAGDVRVAPGRAEFRPRASVHQRPDAAAKPRTKARRRERPARPGRLDEIVGLGHLIAQQPIGVGVRRLRQLAHSDGIACGKCRGSFRDAAVFANEVIEPLHEIGAGEVVSVGLGQRVAQPGDRVGLARQRQSQ